MEMLSLSDYLLRWIPHHSDSSGNPSILVKTLENQFEQLQSETSTTQHLWGHLFSRSWEWMHFNCPPKHDCAPAGSVENKPTEKDKEVK